MFAVNHKRVKFIVQMSNVFVCLIVSQCELTRSVGNMPNRSCVTTLSTFVILGEGYIAAALENYESSTSLGSVKDENAL